MAILVASPNQGTPLATADRWEHLVNILNNILIELFPANQFSTIVEYVIGAVLNFVARHVRRCACPASEAMDDERRRPDQGLCSSNRPGPPAGVDSISPLASKYSADAETVLARIADLGLDAFFDSANDLVVPCEGSWKVSSHNTWVAGAQIGCFGLNLKSASAADGVIHTTYFSQPETVDLLIKTLTQQLLGIARLDLGRRRHRSAVPPPAKRATAPEDSLPPRMLAWRPD